MTICLSIRPSLRSGPASVAATEKVPRTKNVQVCSSFTDRKSTRLNSSHSQISYAVFCLKKKTIDVTMTAIKSKSVYNILNDKVATQCKTTESALVLRLY